jgi:hypothetical protein
MPKKDSCITLMFFVTHFKDLLSVSGLLSVALILLVYSPVLLHAMEAFVGGEV